MKYKKWLPIFCKVFILVLFSNCKNSSKVLLECDKTTALIGESINFKNQSTKTANCIWDFGDGSISTQNNVVKKYDWPGTYLVQLRSGTKRKYSQNQDDQIIKVLPNTVDFEIDSLFESAVSFNIKPKIVGQFISCNLTITEVGFDETNNDGKEFNCIVAKKGWYTFTMTVLFANRENLSITKVYSARPGRGNIRFVRADTSGHIEELSISIEGVDVDYNSTQYIGWYYGPNSSGADCIYQASSGFENIPGGTYDVVYKYKVHSISPFTYGFIRVTVDNNCVKI